MDLVLVYSRIEFSKENSGEPKHIGGGTDLLKLAISAQNGKPVRGVKWCRDSFDRVNFGGLKSSPNVGGAVSAGSRSPGRPYYKTPGCRGAYYATRWARLAVREYQVCIAS
jgi:hypothetical protein